jgi:hypothetical protein
MSPDGDRPGTFGYWLRLSMNELLKAGVPVTMDEANISVFEDTGFYDGYAEISFTYTRQGGSGSNQMALWIEDGEGNVVKTLLATEFTVDGGYTFREQSIPLWVERSGLADMTEEQVDAVSSATPQAGNLSYTWDLTDESGKLVPPGLYTMYLEGSLRFENQVLYTAVIDTELETWWPPSAELHVIHEYFGDSEAERGMISDVKVIFKGKSSSPWELY